ncbi:putative diacylglycerol O-acyltransferase tgs1 [Sorochytrium milnesiophthora]
MDSADVDDVAATNGVTQRTRKYFAQRHRLFERYDEGIMMDEEGWFSVTPECIARHIAQRCRSGLVVDAFAGMGGNAIQFALTCDRVVAIDIDPKKIECARHNARIYGVEDKIEFVLADALTWLRETDVQPDVIFLSPPWGGPEYLQQPYYTLDMIPLDGLDLFRLARSKADNVVYYLPRTTPNWALAPLVEETDSPAQLFEIEEQFLSGKCKAISVYFGNMFLPHPPQPASFSQQRKRKPSATLVPDSEHDTAHKPDIIRPALSNKEQARLLRQSLLSQR